MALSTHLGGYTIQENTRPEWLTDDTGARLELDFIIEELNVAIEVQGAQHYVFTPHFHSDHKAFAGAMRRDEFKQRACLERGVRLYEVASASEVIDVIEDIQLNIASVSFVPTDMQPIRDAGKARMKANNQREHNAAVVRKRVARKLQKQKRNKKPQPQPKPRIEPQPRIHPLAECVSCGEMRSTINSMETRDPEFSGTNTCRACRKRIRAERALE